MSDRPRLRFEVKKKPLDGTLDTLEKALEDRDIIEVSGNSLRILNEQYFKEIGVGLFVGWLCEKHRPKNYDLCFLKIASDKTIILFEPAGSRKTAFVWTEEFVESFNDVLHTGKKYERCWLDHFLLCNLKTLNDDPIRSDNLDVPLHQDASDCHDHICRLQQWICRAVAKKEKEKVRGLGGYCHFVNAPMPAELFAPEATDYERLFNAYLVLYCASLIERPKFYAANGELARPIQTGELDGVLYSSKNGITILETTRSREAADHFSKAKAKTLLSYFSLCEDRELDFSYLYVVGWEDNLNCSSETSSFSWIFNSESCPINAQYIALPPDAKIDSEVVSHVWPEESIRYYFRRMICNIRQII